ncbi:MAG: aldo/keto reductase [Desulfurococcales archaeon]|nr:aldo/keto reductase [Desulfurococcales archaeon]
MGLSLSGSRIGYGVYSLTGMYGAVPRSEAEELVLEAVEMGVEMLDTADIYGRGLGEELAGLAAGRVLIATKVGYDLSSPRPVLRMDEEYLVKAARASRRRLRVDSIDLLQIHNPPLEALKGAGVYRALRRIREEGIARHTGIALGPEVDVLPHAVEALAHDEVESLQFVYNMLEQEPGHTIARMAKEAGVATLVRVPHAGGVLDETLEPGGEEGLSDHRTLRRSGWYRWAHRVYRTRIKPLLDPLPGSPGQKALRFIQQSIDPSYIIVIATGRERLADYLAYRSIPPLPESVVSRIIEVYREEVESSPEKPRHLGRAPP